jgi:4-hydroxy-tetrahydrodipicolinate synthase
MRCGVILAALLTPFNPNGEIDSEALSKHVKDLRTAGVDGFFVCGTTGEGPLLDDEEVVSVTQTVLSSCDRSCSVMAQVGRPSTRATLRLLAKVLEAGAHGVTAVTPYFYQLKDEQLESHYRALIDAANGRPVYAYVIPRRTGNDVRPDLARKLAGKGLAGIKDSTRSLESHLEYLRIGSEPTTKTFEVYMGTDGFATEAFRCGSTGIVSAIANIRPELLISLRALLTEGREAAALECQREINSLRQTWVQADTIGNLKLGVRQRLAGQGVTYPTLLRAPLGASAP